MYNQLNITFNWHSYSHWYIGRKAPCGCTNVDCDWLDSESYSYILQFWRFQIIIWAEGWKKDVERD